MRPFKKKRLVGAPDRPAGFLSRLRRDTRGNVLALVALWLLPLAAFSGSAIDMGRIYAVRIRLQQACDSGVLAGRKSMVGTTLDTTGSGQAQTFFKNNFRFDATANKGWFSTNNVSFTPSLSSDYQVNGTATATVPMTLMAIFGQPSKTLTVSCQARYDVADADIMFVLDTTGSMACTTADDPCGAAAKSYNRTDGTTGYYDVEESGSKISGLRAAVLSFYDTLAGSADSSTHIRYGFVPYTSTVNVGAAISNLNSSYLVSRWQYQSRYAVGDKTYSRGSGTVVSATSQSNCLSNYSRSPALTTSTKSTDGTAYTNYTYGSNGTATAYDPVYAQNTSGQWICTVYKDTIIPIWRYQQWPFDVSNYIATLGTSNTVDDPTKVDSTKSAWQGCIEETNTTASSSFDASNLPSDLNPDLVPSASVNAYGFPTSSDTRWRPMWPGVVYYRDYAGSTLDHTGSSINPYGDEPADTAMPKSGGAATYNNVSYSGILQLGYSTCGMPAQRLAVLTRDQVSAYVNNNDFRAIGGTYHDTGMIWGTRLISPSGIFKNDTAAWTGRQAPNRYIVFMTDGEMSPNQFVYGMYGMEQYDGRVTGAAGNSYSSTTDLNNHNARFVAECQAAKNRNITVFVVGFGQSLNSQLTACASPGQAYYASDNASLTTAFQKIAQQVAMLRISK